MTDNPNAETHYQRADRVSSTVFGSSENVQYAQVHATLAVADALRDLIDEMKPPAVTFSLAQEDERITAYNKIVDILNEHPRRSAISTLGRIEEVLNL